MRFLLWIVIQVNVFLGALVAMEEEKNIKIEDLLTVSLSLTTFEEQPPMIFSPSWFKAAEAMAPYVESYNKIAGPLKDGIDVHNFNKLFNWRGILGNLTEIDNLVFKSHSEWTVDEVVGFLRKTPEYISLGEPDKTQLESNLERLLGYVRLQPIEVSETNCNVPQIMSRIWSLITIMGRGEWGGNLNPSEEIYELIFYINENSAESGGCYQGFAGRICRNYFVLLQKMLDLFGEPKFK